MILDTLAASTRKRVEAAKEKIPLGTMMNLASQASEARQNGAKESVFSFEKALKEPGMSFICEVKKASPSKGLIAPDFPYVDIARDYEAAGAAAISVLFSGQQRLSEGNPRARLCAPASQGFYH